MEFPFSRLLAPGAAFPLRPRLIFPRTVVPLYFPQAAGSHRIFISLVKQQERTVFSLYSKKQQEFQISKFRYTSRLKACFSFARRHPPFR